MDLLLENTSRKLGSKKNCEVWMHKINQKPRVIKSIKTTNQTHFKNLKRGYDLQELLYRHLNDDDLQGIIRIYNLKKEVGKNGQITMHIS